MGEFKKADQCDIKLEKIDIIDKIIALDCTYNAFCILLADNIYVKSLDDGVIKDNYRLGIMMIHDLIRASGNEILDMVENFNQ